ncbi:MAG: hypothetical protein LQ352_001740 [Teloschistes flavicans]|nr:MAG: hypothetical protein LQ352_001740 [Teloschistes flavicans]
MDQAPVLPHGSPTTFAGLSETFSFHASPESFISSKVLAFQKSDPALAQSRTPIHAKILNRNVAVISSYDHVRQILCDEAVASNLSSGKAYNELMAPFFPPPNLLLLDTPEHQQQKSIWLEQMKSSESTVCAMVSKIVLDHLCHVPSGSSIDLYESMKSLSWKILLSIFLSNGEGGESGASTHDTVEALQEDLLRGQFSLFPISVNTPFWRSPRSKGLEARRRLESLLASKVIQGGCPFATSTGEERQDVASHLLLFTSSLAAKALASLLTALLLNVYVFRSEAPESSLGDRIRAMDDGRLRSEYLKNLVLETERLSPPVVGIMRRTTQDIILSSPVNRSQEQSPAPTMIPKGWDVWIYFVGAARDSVTFGGTAEAFMPDRYVNDGLNDIEQQGGFAFGAGAKSCLGRDLIRSVAVKVVETCLGLNTEGSLSQSPAQPPNVKIVGDPSQIPNGVQAWLGWQQDVAPEHWAKDIKQLPIQRPRKSIIVQVLH